MPDDSPVPGPAPGRLLLVVTIVVGAAALGALGVYGVNRSQRTAGGDPTTLSLVTWEDQAKLDRTIEEFCSACHVLPPPSSFPKEAWRKEVQQGFDLAAPRLRDLPVAPPFEETVRYFENRAPQRLQLPPTGESNENSPVLFEAHDYSVRGNPATPAISNVRYARLSPPHAHVIIACDMRTGVVLLLDLNSTEPHLEVVARVPHPDHATPVDLDQDGYMDLLVADLGGYLPEDHTNGQVVWLRREPGDATYKPYVLAEGIGRVADVQAADFDADGDLDLIVASFGWRKVGEVLYMENVTRDWASPRFERHTLAQKTGSIHVPVSDLNGDGRPDFVALFSQEHEQIVAFLNEGGGRFRQEMIFMASDPAYGSTGIELVDLDQDGDLDVLYTNGDSLDSILIKPFHSIQWLENQGRFPFRYHHLTSMPGVHRALAADLDDDGDLDIVAGAFLANVQVAVQLTLKLDSLIWLENRDGRFVRHSLRKGPCDHATLELADVDADGRVDLIVGRFSTEKHERAQTRGWITVYENKLMAAAHSSLPRLTPVYVGAASCAECHQTQFDGFRDTAHHLTSQLAIAESISGDFSPGKNLLRTGNPNLQFELLADERGFFQTAVETRAGQRNTQRERFDIVIGSGKAGQTYLYWQGNKLYQLPVSYSRARGEWINSPGYTDGEADFRGLISARCLECHATYVAPVVPGHEISVGFKKDDFVLGISCERCHGPGQDHIQFHRGHPDAQEAHAIVRPAKLPTARQNDICSQCHCGLGRSVGPAFQFQPGEPLQNYLKLEPPDQLNRLGVHSNNQFARLSKSRCFRESEAMTCTTCHDPHKLERGQLATFSQRCIQCHTSEACGMAERLGSSIKENCIDCHMPKSEDLGTEFSTASGVEYPLMRDHFIAIYPGNAKAVMQRWRKPTERSADTPASPK